ncbi:hypothetical protein FB446DRAFT_359501 [Lentinula raphanica]|nr:hypothetical protein FB446DRAFT_359501 [Lentinula raphanica]
MKLVFDFLLFLELTETLAVDLRFRRSMTSRRTVMVASPRMRCERRMVGPWSLTSRTCRRSTLRNPWPGWFLRVGRRAGLNNHRSEMTKTTLSAGSQQIVVAQCTYFKMTRTHQFDEHFRTRVRLCEKGLRWDGWVVSERPAESWRKNPSLRLIASAQ